MIWLLGIPALLATAFTLVCVAGLQVPVRVPAPAKRRESLGAPIFVLRPVERADVAWLARVAAEAKALAQDAIRPVFVIVCGPDAEHACAPFELLSANSEVATNAPCNRKVRHLAAGARRADLLLARDAAEAIFVQVDADVCLHARDVDALTGTLEAGGKDDIAFAFPAFAFGRGLGSWLASAILMSSPQSFAVVAALARLTRSTPAIAGKFLALRRSTLERMGGYEAIERAIGDDVLMVHRIRELGGVARPSPRAVVTAPGDATLAALLARMTRWLRVIRAQRPWLLATYPTLVAPLPMAIICAGVAASISGTFGAAAWAPLAALLAARTLLAFVLAGGAYRGHALRSALVAPVLASLADAVLLVAFAGALLERRIVWAGRVYDVGAGGRISGVRST